MAAAEMRRKLVLLVAQPTEIDDALHSGITCGFREVPSGSTVRLLEVVGRSHRMHKVVRRLDASHRGRERLAVQDIAPYNLDGVRDASGQKLGMPPGNARESSARIRGAVIGLPRNRLLP